MISLERTLSISFALHLVAIILLALKEALLPSDPIIFTPSLRVDLVALPDQKINETLTPPVEPEPEPRPEKPTPTVEKKETRDLTPSQSGLAEINLKKKKEKESRKKKLEQAIRKIRALERIKGNVLSKGSAVSGEAKLSLETSYFDIVLENIRLHWELPRWLQDRPLQARAKIKVAPSGQIILIQITESSGVQAYDLEVKRALQAASPLPEPPEALKGDLLKNGLVLGFPI